MVILVSTFMVAQAMTFGTGNAFLSKMHQMQMQFNHLSQAHRNYIHAFSAAASLPAAAINKQLQQHLNASATNLIGQTSLYTRYFSPFPWLAAPSVSASPPAAATPSPSSRSASSKEPPTKKAKRGRKSNDEKKEYDEMMHQFMIEFLPTGRVHLCVGFAAATTS